MQHQQHSSWAQMKSLSPAKEIYTFPSSSNPSNWFSSSMSVLWISRSALVPSLNLLPPSASISSMKMMHGWTEKWNSSRVEWSVTKLGWLYWKQNAWHSLFILHFCGNVGIIVNIYFGDKCNSNPVSSYVPSKTHNQLLITTTPSVN